MSLPTHRQYKESGIQWLGPVPDHWSIARFKQLMREIDKRAGTGSYELLGLSKALGVVKRAALEQSAAESDDYGKYKVAKPGQLVMNKMQAWNGVFGIAPELGIVSPDYSVFEVLNPGYITFLCVLCKTDLMAGVFLTRSRGMGTAFLRLNTSDLLDTPVALPSAEEAGLISAFLDKEVAKIDSLVEEQLRLIELLKEKRQAVISHAVTRGLAAASPLKDSGDPAIGLIPQGWLTGPVKRFFTNLDSKRVPLSSEERAGRRGQFPYYGASGIIDHVDDYLYDETLVLVSEDGANLVNRSTPVAFVAKGKYWVNNHAHILRPYDGAPTFWAARIEDIDLSPYVTGSAQPKFTAEALANLPVSAPANPDERLAIEAHIIELEGQTALLISEAGKMVRLLEERRSAS